MWQNMNFEKTFISRWALNIFSRCFFYWVGITEHVNCTFLRWVHVVANFPEKSILFRSTIVCFVAEKYEQVLSVLLFMKVRGAFKNLKAWQENWNYSKVWPFHDKKILHHKKFSRFLWNFAEIFLQFLNIFFWKEHIHLYNPPFF